MKTRIPLAVARKPIASRERLRVGRDFPPFTIVAQNNRVAVSKFKPPPVLRTRKNLDFSTEPQRSLGAVPRGREKNEKSRRVETSHANTLEPGALRKVPRNSASGLRNASGRNCRPDAPPTLGGASKTDAAPDAFILRVLGLSLREVSKPSGRTALR